MHTIYTIDLLSSYILGSNLSTKNLSDDIFEINMVKKNRLRIGSTNVNQFI